MLKDVLPLQICILAGGLVTLTLTNASSGQSPPFGERQVLATFADGGRGEDTSRQDGPESQATTDCAAPRAGLDEQGDCGSAWH